MDHPNMHWSDVIIKAGSSNIVDLEEQIIMRKSGNFVDRKPSQGSSIVTPTPKTPGDDADANSRQGTSNAGDKVVLLDPESFLM